MRYQELKACPFCGGKPYRPEDISGGVSICCLDCGVQVSFVVKSKQRAMIEWNRRETVNESSGA